MIYNLFINKDDKINFKIKFICHNCHYNLEDVITYID